MPYADYAFQQELIDVLKKRNKIEEKKISLTLLKYGLELGEVTLDEYKKGVTEILDS